MRTGVGLLLIGTGAILAFAVTTNTSVFNLHTAGYVLILVGIAGLFIPRRGYQRIGRRLLVRRERPLRGSRREETNLPPYVTRNPGDARVRAGLPPSPSVRSGKEAAQSGDVTVDDLLARDHDRDTLPLETEIIEDVYEP